MYIKMTARLSVKTDNWLRSLMYQRRPTMKRNLKLSKKINKQTNKQTKKLCPVVLATERVILHSKRHTVHTTPPSHSYVSRYGSERYPHRLSAVQKSQMANKSHLKKNTFTKRDSKIETTTAKQKLTNKPKHANKQKL